MTIEYITPEQGPAEIQSAINDGAEHVHLAAGAYDLHKPIFIQGLDKFTLTGDTGAILRHVRQAKKAAMVFNLCPDTTISGIDFDFYRVKWNAFKCGIRCQVPDFAVGKNGHIGPAEVKKFNLTLIGNRITDSQNIRNPRAAGNRGDNWWLVLKDSQDNFNLNVSGNHVTAYDLEMTGGPQFFTNTVFNNNVIQGGRTAGGLISCLTKGQSGRRIQNMQITNNLCMELNNYFISVGFDSDDSSEGIDFDNVLISGNRAVLGATPANFVHYILLKYAGYTGVTQIFDNSLDCQNVAADYAPFNPRFIAHKNVGGSADNPMGHVYYDDLKVTLPENPTWGVSIPGSGRDRFETFARMN